MTEKLEVYDLDSNILGIQDRKSFYQEIREEFKKTNKISRKVKSIRLLLMNSQGRIYLQKRSNFKKENAGLYDKTVGGHVSAGESFGLTVVRECVEELGFPATILTQEEFKKAVKGTNLEIIGVFREIEILDNLNSERLVHNGESFIQPFIGAFYIGYYDGAIRFVDGESSGIEIFSLDELKKEIAENPAKFTKDIKFMIEKYEGFLISVDQI